MHSFYSKTVFTFLLLLITFETLEINQSYIPHLKVLVCGINASSSQQGGCIFILCYTHLKLTLLLHKQGLVATGVATTVFELVYFFMDTLQYLKQPTNLSKVMCLQSSKIVPLMHWTTLSQFSCQSQCGPALDKGCFDRLIKKFSILHFSVYVLLELNFYGI